MELFSQMPPSNNYSLSKIFLKKHIPPKNLKDIFKGKSQMVIFFTVLSLFVLRFFFLRKRGKEKEH